MNPGLDGLSCICGTPTEVGCNRRVGTLIFLIARGVAMLPLWWAVWFVESRIEA